MIKLSDVDLLEYVYRNWETQEFAEHFGWGNYTTFEDFRNALSELVQQELKQKDDLYNLPQLP